MRYEPINPELFKTNRRRLRARLQPGQVIVLRASKPVVRSNDTEYPYSQDRNFFWATGIDQPDSVLVLTKDDETLYIRPTNDFERVWMGERLSLDESSVISGIYDVQRLDKFKKPVEEFDGIKLIAELRMIKSPIEIELIKKAIAITAEGFAAAKRAIKEGIYEYEVEAEITHAYTKNGAAHAYEPIVAFGLHATYLHYVKNNNSFTAGGLLLIDSGAEYANYAADITRVFPVGEFTPRQKAVYDAVLRVKDYAESLLKPGVLIKEYESQVGEKMAHELEGLGLKPKLSSSGSIRMDSPIKSGNDKLWYRQFYPHGTSHFLGLDVHDAGDYSKPLEPGMVITCEPGIYIRDERIGIRLEDDILITKDGNQNLSADIPI